jgi:hypothetical protein
MWVNYLEKCFNLAHYFKNVWFLQWLIHILLSVPPETYFELCYCEEHCYKQLPSCYCGHLQTSFKINCCPISILKSRWFVFHFKPVLCQNCLLIHNFQSYSLSYLRNMAEIWINCNCYEWFTEAIYSYLWYSSYFVAVKH